LARRTYAGLDSAALASALDSAGTQASTAMVVLWRGRLVAERYWDGWTATTVGPWFSAGQTITSALVSHLAAEGRLSRDAPARTQLGAGWSRAPLVEPGITVRHLLSMASGLGDSLAFVTAPGARFYYNNNPGYYQLFAVVASAAGRPVGRCRRWPASCSSRGSGCRAPWRSPAPTPASRGSSSPGQRGTFRASVC
jgi:CubicO group peptidase (beta-lactamase class C family)